MEKEQRMKIGLTCIALAVSMMGLGDMLPRVPQIAKLIFSISEYAPIAYIILVAVLIIVGMILTLI